MVKNRRKTFLAVFTVAVLIVMFSIFCLSTYAALPITGESDPDIYYFTAPAEAINGWTSVTTSQAVSLVKLQFEAGSFNNFRPVLLYYSFSGASSTLRLILSDSDFGDNPNAGGLLGYEEIAGYFEPVEANPNAPASSVIRLLLTNFGFAKYYPGSVPTTVDSTIVLGYWDVEIGEFVYNDGVLTGGVGDNVVYSAFTLWNEYDLSDSAPSYGAGYSAGYEVGYNDGYTLGDELGYEKGFSDGANHEGIQLNVGSIINASIDGAKNIFTDAFGFEIFGINIAGLLITVVTVWIVAFVIRRFSGK